MLIKVTDTYNKHKFYINSDFIVHMSEMYTDRTNFTKIFTYIKTTHSEFSIEESTENIINQIKGN